MDDLEATRLCAEALGLAPYRITAGGIIQQCSGSGIYIEDSRDQRGYSEYDPKRNDAQAMALVKRLTLRIDRTRSIPEKWGVYSRKDFGDTVINADLNRAIVYCVAAMQKAKEAA